MEDYENAVVFPGLEPALLGYGYQYCGPRLAVYSRAGIIETLMKQNQWDNEDALEWFEYNIACLYAGPETPLIVEYTAQEVMQ
tara:strand:+ start:680 stop:928 length:249 start_codon:yes stop_codon:yes gene_type:complete